MDKPSISPLVRKSRNQHPVVPLQAIQAMQEVDQLKKKFGEQIGNSYQQNLAHPLRRNRKQSQGSNTQQMSSVDITQRGLLLLNKSASSSVLSLGRSIEEPLNPRALPSSVFSPHIKINARTFGSKKFNEITKSTLGIQSLMVRDPKESVRFPLIGKQTVHRQEEFEGFLEKSMRKRIQTDDLLANMSIIMAGSAQESVSYSQYFQPSPHEQSSAFFEEKSSRNQKMKPKPQQQQQQHLHHQVLNSFSQVLPDELHQHHEASMIRQEDDDSSSKTNYQFSDDISKITKHLSPNNLTSEGKFTYPYPIEEDHPIDPFMQSVDDTQIFDKWNQFTAGQAMGNQTFEDDFDESMVEIQQTQEITNNNNNNAGKKSLDGEIRMRNRNNYRIEPLDEYDEYSLRDVNFTTVLADGPQQAMSRWQHINGRTYWKNCVVTAYDQSTKMFTIQWANAKKVMEKKVKRLNLMFYFDDPEMFKKRYQAAIRKREEFLFNQGLTEYIDNKQGQEDINLPFDRITRTVERIFTNSQQSSERKQQVLNEVVELYRFQLVKFATEYESMDRDVSRYIEKYLPYMSAAKFVSKMPIKDCSRFESQECEFGMPVKTLITVKPHLCMNPLQLGLFRWVTFQNKRELNENELACLKISQVMLGFIQLIQNLRLFKDFNRSKKIINAKEKKEIEAQYLQQFNRQVNQIDRLAYKVEKGIDEMRLDFPEQISSESAKLLFSISNTLILNSIESSFHASINGLISEVEGYYSVLPLPEVNLKLIRKLPETFFIKRREIRQRLSLDSDEMVEERGVQEFASFVQGIEQQLIQKKKIHLAGSSRRSSGIYITQDPVTDSSPAAAASASQNASPRMNKTNLKESYSAIIFAQYKSLPIMDRTIMNAIAYALQNQFLESSLPTISLNSLNGALTNLPCFPKFQVDWVMNKEYKAKRQNAEQRRSHKINQRAVIYAQNDQQEIILPKQNRIRGKVSIQEPSKNIRLSTSESREEDEQESTLGSESILLQRFEFIKFDLLCTTVSPSPIELEEMLKKQFFTPIDRARRLYEIGKMETTCYTSAQIERDAERAKQAINHIIPFSFYGIYAYIVLIDCFSFLFTQKKHFIQDIIAEAEKSGSELLVYCDEINELERDLMFFRVGIPNYLNFGLFALQVQSLKAEYVAQISMYITELKKILVQKFSDQLTTTEASVTSLSSKMKKTPTTLQEFVDCSDFFSSSEIVETYTEIQQKIYSLKDLMHIMDEYSLMISSETTETFVSSGSWILRLRSLEEESRNKLDASRPRFEKVLSDKIRDLTRRFEAHRVLQQTLRSEETATLTNVFALSHQTKQLKIEIDEIYTVSQELNRFEEYLQIQPVTDFADIRETLNDLMKYYDLWDFAERWRLMQEEWTTRPLIYIESKDVVDTINEGFQLLPDIMRDFSSLPQYITIIGELEAELSQFNSYTHVLIQLRDNCFKPRHWDELIEEIYLRKEQQANSLEGEDKGTSSGQEKRIDAGSITLKKLIDENILSFSSFINRLYHVAVEDSTIEVELSKIEGLLKDTHVKTLPYFLDFAADFSFITIKNIRGIISNLTEASIRVKALITNKSFVEVFKKRMLAVSKLARVGKKVMKIIGRLQNSVLSYAPLMIVESSYEASKTQERLFTRDLIALLKKFIDEFNVHIDALTYQGYNVFMLFSESESQERSFPQSEEFRRRIGETEKLSERVASGVKKVLTKMRISNSRLYFLSDDSLVDVIRLTNPNTSPQIVMNQLILPLFKGISSVKVQADVAEHQTKIDSETFKLSAYAKTVSIISVQNQVEETVQFEKPIVVDWSQGIESALEAQSRIEKEIRACIKKQFVKNSAGINRLGYDYSETLRFVESSQSSVTAASELLLQVLYLNLDVCFYHDLTASMLTCEEHDEMPDSILTDFLTQMRFHLHNFILQSSPSSQKSFLRSKADILKFSGIVMQSLKHQNVLQRFIEQRVDTLASFEYLALPKFTIEVDSNAICRALHVIAKARQPDIPPADIPMPTLNQRDLLSSIVSNTKRVLDARESSEFPNLAEQSPFFQNVNLVENLDYISINLIAMNYKRGYTWEMLGGEHYSFVNTGQTEKMIFNVISAISTNTGVLLRGPPSSGKASTIAMLSTILAKPFYNWRFSNSNDFASLNSVLVGTAQGGYVTLIANCEALSVAMISTLANIVFAIRSSALNRDDSLTYAGNTIKVSEHWGLYASFTLKEDERMVQFSELPNILESFRTVSIVTPDISAILLSKFTLMNFVNPTDSAQRFAVFIQILSSGFADLSNSEKAEEALNSSRKNVREVDKKGEKALQHTSMSAVHLLINPSMRTIMKILNLCEQFLYEKHVLNEELQENFTLLYSGVKGFYANSLSQVELKVLLDIFLQVFPEWNYTEGYSMREFSEDSIIASDADLIAQPSKKTVTTPLGSPVADQAMFFSNAAAKSADEEMAAVNELDQQIVYYFQKKNHILPNESFIRKVEDIVQTLRAGKPIILVGASQFVKNQAIDAAAYALARVNKEQFDKHYVTLDANDWSQFMGEFSEQSVWRKGIMQQLLEMIKHAHEMHKHAECQKEYLHTTTAYFNSQPANPDSLAQEIPSISKKAIQQVATSVQIAHNKEVRRVLKDWIVFETSSDIFRGESGKRYEMMMKCLESGKFYFDNGELITLDSHANSLLNLESLENITPGTFSSFTLFNFNLENTEIQPTPVMLDGMLSSRNAAETNLTRLGMHWSIQQDFEGWLDGLVAQNPFFSLCEKTLRTCYIYLFEPIIIYLADSQSASNSFVQLSVTIAQQQRNFLSILEIFLNEFRKTMIATGMYAITSTSATIKDAKSKAFYTLIALRNRKNKKNKDAGEDQGSPLNEGTAALNTDIAWLDRQYRGPLESIFLFSLIQGLATCYLPPKYLSDFTESSMQCVKRLQSSHKALFSENFKACQNFRKILKQNKEMTVVDVVYDIEQLKWSRMSEFEVRDETPFLDSSLVNDHLEASEIIRLNRSALEIDEIRVFVENEMKISFSIPLEQLRRSQQMLETTSSASFKLVKFMLHYLMGYRRNVFMFSASQAGKTTLTNHLESLHLKRNEIRMIRIPVGQATSISKFQWLIENNLTFKNSHTKASEIGKFTYFCVEDVNLAPTQAGGPNLIGCLRSFLSHNGWFSQVKNRFLKFENSHMMCNYSTNEPDDIQSQLEKYNGCMKDMCLVRFPEMNEMHLTSIFMGIMRHSPFFNSHDRIMTNLVAAEKIQTVLVRFAQFFTNSIRKLQEIQNIYKIAFSIDKVVNIVQKILDQQSLIEPNGQLNSHLFACLWRELFNLSFVNHLPWHNNPKFVEQWARHSHNNSDMITSSPITTRIENDDKHMQTSSRRSDLPLESFIIDQVYSPSLTMQITSTIQLSDSLFSITRLISRGVNTKRTYHDGIGSTPRAGQTADMVGEMEQKYFNLQSAELFDARAKFLNQHFRRDNSLSAQLAKRLQQYSLLDFQVLPIEISKIFQKAILTDVPVNTAEQAVAEDKLMLISQRIFLVSRGQSTLAEQQRISLRNIPPTSQISMKLIELGSEGLQNLSKSEQRKLGTQLVQVNSEEFTEYIKLEFAEYVVEAGKVAGNNNFNALWSIESQLGGVENAIDDIRVMANTMFHGQMNMSLYSSQSQGELIQFVAWLMGCEYVSVSLGSSECVDVLMEAIQDVMKVIAEGQTTHKIVHVKVEDLGGKEFDKLFELLLMVKSIILTENLQGVFAEKMLKKIIEPWKAMQNKRFTSQAHVEANAPAPGSAITQMNVPHLSNEELAATVKNSSSVSTGEIQGNLIDNHLIRLMSGLLRQSVSFVIEVRLENYSQYQMLKDYMPKSFSIFCDHFAFQRDANSTDNSSLLSSQTPDYCQQLTVDRVFAAEKEINELFGKTHFAVGAQPAKEVTLQAKHLADAFFAQISKQSEKRYSTMKNSTANLINTQEIKLPINQKLKELLDQLLVYKQDYIETKQALEDVQTFINENSNLSQYISNSNNTILNASQRPRGEESTLATYETLIAQKYEERDKHRARIDGAKNTYQVAFQNFRQINLLLGSLLKSIHYYRNECHPLLTFTETELQQYSYLTSLYALTALKYPSTYREKLLEILAQETKKLISLPFYKVFGETPTTYLHELLRTTSVGLPLINELSLVETILNVDFLPVYVSDETGLFLEWLQQKKKNVVIEHSTIDSESWSRLEDCVVEGKYLVLINPDEQLIDMAWPLLSWKKRNLVRQVIVQNRGCTQGKKQEKESDTLTFNQKMIQVNSGFRIVVLSTMLSPFLSKMLQSYVVSVNLSLDQKQAFAGHIYEEILDRFHKTEKQSSIKQLMQQIDVLSKLDYSASKLLPLIQSISLLDDNSWQELGFLLPQAVIHASMENGEIEKDHSAKKGKKKRRQSNDDDDDGDDNDSSNGDGENRMTEQMKKQKELEEHERDQLEFKLHSEATEMSSPLGSRSRKHRRDDQEIFGDLELHTEIGEQLDELKRQDAEEEVKTVRNKRGHALTIVAKSGIEQIVHKVRNRGQTFVGVVQKAMIQQEEIVPRRDERVVAKDYIKEDEPKQQVASNNDGSTFAFNFELIDFQENSRLSPNYPALELNTRAEMYKGLVEVIYGIRMSYIEVAREVERDCEAIRYSEENLILVLRQVAENMRANFDAEEEADEDEKKRKEFAKDFASAYYHHLYCTLREDHQVIWMLALAYYFETAALSDKFGVQAKLLERQLLMNGRISHTQKQVFQKLTSDHQFTRFGVALSELYGSYENLVAPLQNKIDSIKQLNARQQRRLKDRIKKQRQNSSTKKKVPKLYFNSTGNAFVKSDEVLQFTDKNEVPFWQNTIKEDSEGSPRDEEDFLDWKDNNNENVQPSVESSVVNSKKTIELPVVDGAAAAATTEPEVEIEVAQGIQIAAAEMNAGNELAEDKMKQQQQQILMSDDSNAQILLNDDDFLSPLVNKNQKAMMRQLNATEIETAFGATSQYLEDHIIDLPMIRSSENPDKDFMYKIKEEFVGLSSSSHIPIQSKSEGLIIQPTLPAPIEKGILHAQHDDVSNQNEEPSELNENQIKQIQERRNAWVQPSAMAASSSGLAPWTSDQAYQSLIHLASVVNCPKLSKFLQSTTINKDQWVKFVQESHSEIFDDSNAFWSVLASKVSHENLGIMLKCIRPDILERFLNTCLVKPLSRYFSSNSKTNLTTHSRSLWYRKPTILLYGTLNKSITELLELKATRGSSQVKRIALGSIGNSRVKELLEAASEKGDWVVLENIKHVHEAYITGLIKIIQQSLESSRAHPGYRVWITYQQLSGSYDISSSNDKGSIASTLTRFLRGCFRMFLNRPSSIKAHLSVLYSLAIHEHIAQVEKKIAKAGQPLVGGNSHTISKQQPHSTEEVMKYRVKVQKRSTNLVSSFNLHTVFVDKDRLRETNKVTIALLGKMSEKIKFNIYFAFSLLRMRHRYHHAMSKDYLKNDIIFFSDLDLLYIVEDGFQFLGTYTMSPSVFFRNYLTAIFAESMHYFGGSTWSITAMRDVLEEIVFKGIDRQTILNVQGQKYTLYFEQPEQTTENTIFNTISELPSVDPPAILEISHNTEVVYNQLHSERMMVRLHKEVSRDSMFNHAEMINQVNDTIEDTIISSDDGASKRVLHGQQIRQIFAYWENQVDQLGKHKRLLDELVAVVESFQKGLHDVVRSKVFRDRFDKSMNSSDYSSSDEDDYEEEEEYDDDEQEDDGKTSFRIRKESDQSNSLTSSLPEKNKEADGLPSLKSQRSNSQQKRVSIMSNYQKETNSMSGSMRDSKERKKSKKVSLKVIDTLGMSKSIDKGNNNQPWKISVNIEPSSVGEDSNSNTVTDRDMSVNMQENLMKWLSDKPLQEQPNKSRKSVIIQPIKSRDNLESRTSSPNVSRSPSIRTSFWQLPKIQVAGPRQSGVNLGGRNVDEQRRTLSNLPGLSNGTPMTVSRRQLSSGIGLQGSPAKRNSVFFGKPFAADQLSVVMGSPMLSASPGTSPLRSSMQLQLGKKKASASETRMSLFNLSKISESQVGEQMKELKMMSISTRMKSQENKAQNLIIEAVFLSTISNERAAASKLINQMTADLKKIRKISKFEELSGRTIDQSSLFSRYESEVDKIRSMLAQNRTPRNWWSLAFLSADQKLSVFIEHLISKLEWIQTLCQERKSIMYPVISMNRMFDPFFLLATLLRARSNELNTTIADLVIECEVLNKPVSAQPIDGSIHLNGFFIQRGKLNPNLSLDTDGAQELEFRMPNIKVTVRKKTFINNFYTSQCPSVSMAFKEEHTSDFEGTFYQQNQFVNGIKQQIRGDKENRRAAQGESRQFVVRLPVVNPNVNHLFSQFPIRIYFYLRSSRSQEFWVKRATEIYLSQQFSA